MIDQRLLFRRKTKSKSCASPSFSTVGYLKSHLVLRHVSSLVRVAYVGDGDAVFAAVVTPDSVSGLEKTGRRACNAIWSL